MRFPPSIFLLPALLLAACGTTPQAAVPSSPERLLTVNVTAAQTDADLTRRYGGRVVLRTSTFAVIGDPSRTLGAQDLTTRPQRNRGVLQASGTVNGLGMVGLWGNGMVGLWGNGMVGLWGNGMVGLWGNGMVGLWGNGAENFWTNDQYAGLPANTDAWKSIGLNAAYQQSAALGRNVTVAVIDTGVDVQHPMLSGRLSDPSTWQDFVDGDALPQETGTAGEGEYGHGTVIAGITAQIAPNARIMPLRVLDEQGSGDVLNVASAIVWAADHGANVINLSLGASETVPAIDSAIAYANSQGVAVIAAAGNTGQNGLDYPAASFTAGTGSLNVSVGSVNVAGQRSGFSSYGAGLQLSAPGERITGPFPGERFAEWSGTSMSAPVVAGAVALGLGDGRAPAQAVDALRATASQSAQASQSELRVNLDLYTKLH